MTKFETAEELISFVKEKGMKRGFYKKSGRIQYLIGFDSMGMMSVTTPPQVAKGRLGKKYSATGWNMLNDSNLNKLDWFLKAEYIGQNLDGAKND